ncbi:hypothetical protein [Luteolibacter sp. LG18]|uniref:hypothetical protein n=1 Tax=Luteolibacter sp. LG18 TaxID=2819286 RepID=UPI002B2A6824|nr:hypothetical protein llg_41980 [Luteolibacter sp. LG18]
MKPLHLIAVFAVLLTISLFVRSHDRSVAPLRRELDQRSIGRQRPLEQMGGVVEEKESRKREGDSRPQASAGSDAPSGRVASNAPVASAEVAGVPVDDVEEFTPVEASLPGNTLRVNRGSVLVRGFRPVSGTSGVALAVSVEKTADGGEDEALVAPVASRHPRRGLSYEDELFRTKWGWTAFADVRQTALETSAD